jgi:hypothetical protein
MEDFMQRRTSLLCLTLSLLLVTFTFASPHSASAAPATGVTDDQPTLNFPDSITFHATLESNAPITSVTLEYGTDQQTCGTVLAKAFPQFTPNTTVNAQWTWEMKQSGSLPPGATLWWRWRYTDKNGVENVSDKKNTIWLDSTHNWQTVTSGLINLHWYSGDKAFAQDLLNAAIAGLELLKNDAGLQPDQPINLYIYANTADMQAAILYEPSWTGGMAFPEHNIVIIGISPQDLAWGRSTITHELTHVLVGHFTFSCLSDVPTWLNEGLAVYSEGGLDTQSKDQLDQAISSDQLLTVRSLSGPFSEVSSKANLSYSESYSIVNFLIKTYGQGKMNSLLIALRDGATVDDALQSVYGFNIEGMEGAWRASIGAPPRPGSVNPTAQPAPTIVPTYVPFSGASLAVTPTPYAVPTSSSTEPPPQQNGPPISLTLILISVCCVLILLVGVLGLGVYLASQKNKGDHNEPGA